MDGSVQEVRDMVIQNIELAEAMKQICSSSSPAGDVVLNCSRWWSGGEVDLGIESGGCNRR